MKKIVVIDGQGGKIGSLLTSRIKALNLNCEIFAVGTNSLATAAMLKAGADYGATGENPVIVNCRDADIIVGPIGIVVADSLLGEVTPGMAVAVGQSRAQKVYLPLNKCNNHIAGSRDLPFPELIEAAVKNVASFFLD
ncbi:MAG: DUF3842 family protein [Clostridiales bacterium]|jgi:hypothetical protein|nr:DUF3842 family protein [Clostridiales bacterium]